MARGKKFEIVDSRKPRSAEDAPDNVDGIDSDDPKAFGARQIMTRYEAGLHASRLARKDFEMNNAFVRSQQWVHYSQSSRRIEPVLPEDDRVQATANRMLPAARTLAGKITQRSLRNGLEVPSTKADDANIRASRIAHSIVESVHTDHDWEQLRDLLTWSILKGGSAAIAVEWDSEAGEYIGEDRAGRSLHKGDTVETVLNISEFVVQPGVKNAEKAHWWIKVQALPPDQVQALYNLPKRPPADSSAAMSPLETRLMGLGEENVELTLVLTYYERPNKTCPKGRVAVLVDGKVVGKGDTEEERIKNWPFPWSDKLNIAVAGDVPVAGTWMHETSFTAVRSLQVAYNSVWSAIIEHIKNAGNARLAVPQSNIDLIEDLTDLPGEIVTYLDGTAPPNYIAPAQLPAYILEMPNRIAEQMDDILGVHEVSRGTMPTNIESGVGLSILAENDSTPVGRIIKEETRAFERVGQMVLKLYEKNVTETREAVVRVPGLPAMTQTWTGKDLLGQTNVRIPADTIMPRSAAAAQARADKMMQMGLITSVSQYARIAELPDATSILSVAAPDIDKAQRENNRMRMGVVCVPEQFDNHAEHITEHNVFRKSQEYELLDEKTQQLFDDHVQAHANLAANEAGNQLSKASIDPMLATVPTAEEAPTVPVDQAQMAATGNMPPPETPAQQSMEQEPVPSGIQQQ